MSAPISRDAVKGALYSVLDEVKHEAENLVNFPGYLEQIIESLGEQRVKKALATAAILAPRLQSGPELARIFQANVDLRAEIAKRKLEHTPELCIMRFETYAAALAHEPAANPAGPAEYLEAEELVYVAQTRRARIEALPKIWTGNELAAAKIPPLKWIVSDLLPQGLFLLIGLFKLGKSWFVLALCIAVSSGGIFLGRYRVKALEVLYLALEDGPRRIISRVEKMGEKIPQALHIAFEWRRGIEGVADLRAWLAENTRVGLVVIDTLSRFRGVATNDDAWGRDYDELAEIKRLADEFGIAIVIVHHRSKAQRDDIHQTAAGTNALQGAVDGSLLLDRKRGEHLGSLSVTGRDIPEKDIGLNFDPDHGLWTAVDGDPADLRLSTERASILAFVIAQGGREVTTSAVAEGTGRAKSSASELLTALFKEGMIAKGKKYGTYAPIYINESPELPNIETPSPFGYSEDSGTYRPPCDNDEEQEL